jgi:hypothetical protein
LDGLFELCPELIPQEQILNQHIYPDVMWHHTKMYIENILQNEETEDQCLHNDSEPISPQWLELPS